MSAAKVFARNFTAKNLRRIYREKISTSRAIGLDRVRPHKLAERLPSELNLIRRKIADGSYKFTAYKEKLISKGAGKIPRVVSIPTARDRVVLRALCDFLQEVFPHAVPELPQVKIEELQTQLASAKHAEFVKIDIQGYYPSIPQDLLKRILKKKIRKPEIHQLIEAAIQTPTVPESKGRAGASANTKGVPQGLAISNLLAEIAIAEVDAKYKADKAIWYSRYVDDILILCPSGQAEAIGKKITSELKAIGLHPHELGASGSKSKTGKLTEKFVFLGYEVDGANLSIRSESVRKFEGSLASIFTAYRHRLVSARSAAAKDAAVEMCKWRLNLRITGCIFKGKRLGWVFYFSQITQTSRLHAVESTIDSLLNRFYLKTYIKPKSLIKTHYESRRQSKTSHRYIPNFDTMGIAEKRRILGLYIGASRVARLSDKRVEQLFEMRISAAVKELEADLAGAS